MNEIQKKLSADPGSLILGIISLLIGIIGCCCGFLAIPAIIMSIIGLVWAIKSQKAYHLEPEVYSARSYASVNTAKIINIIALVLSTIFFFVALLWFGSMMMNPGDFMEKLESGDFSTGTEAYDDDFEKGTDSEVDTWEYEESTDSLGNDIEIIEMEIQEEDTLNN